MKFKVTRIEVFDLEICLAKLFKEHWELISHSYVPHDNTVLCIFKKI